MKKAIIDLGTNTFHLMIVEGEPGQYDTLFRESRPAKIGKAGINQGFITDEAIERALAVLQYFREKLDHFQVPEAQVTAMGTSAIRNAANQEAFLDRIVRQTGIRVQVISGEEEATYIYRGVRAAGALDNRTALIMDIGGGSVEFILCQRDRIFWKQSFEIGGQRLMERYMDGSPERPDPISPAAVRKLHHYLDQQLLPLRNAVHQYRPALLVGSSGTFDTLVDMHYQYLRQQWPPAEQTTFELPVEEFYRSYALLLSRNHADRLAIPGMIELRVDMIVVAVCLIDYVLRAFGIGDIRVSTYALKEGVLFNE